MHHIKAKECKLTLELSEHKIQAQTIELCNQFAVKYPQLSLVFAIPNGAWFAGNNRYALYNKYLAEGLKAGVPDIHLPAPNYSKTKHGLFIEFKAKGRTTSKQQDWWLDELVKVGNETVVCYSSTDAFEYIICYLTGKSLSENGIKIWG